MARTKRVQIKQSKKVKGVKRTKRVKRRSMTLKYGGMFRGKSKPTVKDPKKIFNEKKYQQIIVEDKAQMSQKQDALNEFKIDEAELLHPNPQLLEGLLEGIKHQVLDKFSGVKNFKEKFPEWPVIDIFKEYDRELGFFLDIKGLMRNKETGLLPVSLDSVQDSLSSKLLDHYMQFIKYKKEFIEFAKNNSKGVKMNSKRDEMNSIHVDYIGPDELAKLLLLYDAMKACLKLEHNKNISESNLALREGEDTVDEPSSTDEPSLNGV
jgi:hypothetical protein